MTPKKSIRVKQTPYQPLGNYDFVQSAGYASLRDLYNNKHDPMWAGFADGALRYCSDNAHWIRRAWMDFDEVVSDWMYTLATPAAGRFDPTRASPIAHGRLWFNRVLVRVMRTYARSANGVSGYGVNPGDGDYDEWERSLGVPHHAKDLGYARSGVRIVDRYTELVGELTDTSTPESQEEFYELCDMFETACQQAGVDPNHVWDSLVTKTRRGPVSRRAEQVLVTLREKLEEDYEEYTPNASV